MSNEPYKLRCTLRGHSMDVRSVAVIHHPSEAIITGSRDKTARLWTPDKNRKGGFEAVQCYTSHEQYVSCVCAMPPDEKYPEGLIVTGSNDKIIRGFSPNHPDPVFTLRGHEGNVCSLAAGRFCTLVSGSWDCSARVWQNEICMATLDGHSAAVWAVAIVPGSQIILTASADKTIKIWQGDKCQHNCLGHTDCVRALAVLSPSEFVSCSNDASIKKWNISGECLASLYGHSNFIYSVSVLPNGIDLVSSGEDRTVRVWNGTECEQTIFLPAHSIWGVAVLANGDIVAGCSDGTCRVFSRNPDRWASPEELKELEDELSATQVASSGELGGMKVSDLPGKEVLNAPGKKDGQTKMVRDGINVVLYAWNMAEETWTKVGDVVGANKPEKTLHEGKEYDYVFTVDVEEGKPPLKLPYNITEEPWYAAQAFIENNNLSQLYLDQVANFIIQNTKDKAPKQYQTPGEAFADPFTGGNRYIPGTGEASSSSSSQGTDPFTGSGRYIPSEESRAGDGMESGEVPDAALLANNPYFPQKDYVRFDTANSAALLGKLLEFRTNANQQLDEEILVSAVTAVENPNNDVSRTELSMMEKLFSWPTEKLFPVLDMLRLAIRNPIANKYFCEENKVEFSQRILHFLTPEMPPVNQMLTLRIISNAFVHDPGRELMLMMEKDILSQLSDIGAPKWKTGDVAAMTVLLNYSIALFKRARDFDSKLQCLSTLASVMKDANDKEAIFRGLVTLGTLLYGDRELASAASVLGLPQVVKINQSILDPPKVAECAGYLSSVL